MIKSAPTVFAARQLINHGHIKVNKKRVNVSSYLLKDTDQVEVNEKSKKLNVIQENSTIFPGINPGRNIQSKIMTVSKKYL